MATILLIDDDDLLVQSLEFALKRFGHSVYIVRTAEKGIENYSRNAFDIVITDMKMPGKGGLAVLKHIRGSDKPLTPVIGISATPSSMERGNFNATLSKPFCLHKLLEIIKRLEDSLSGNPAFEPV